MNFVGKRLRFRYESGLEIDGHYVSDSEVHWVAVNGPEAGRSGRETIHAVEVASGIFFINWVEQNGATVSQVLDLKRKRVAAFTTRTLGGVRRAYLNQGSFTETPAEPAPAP